MSSLKRVLLITTLALISTACPAAEKSYPQRPVRFIVPFPPGGANDIVARLVGPKLTERLGQPVVVDNRPGAAGTIALDLAARAHPDGHTLLVGNNTSNGIVPILYADRMQTNPRKNLTGISLLAAIPHVLVATAKFPPNSYEELVAYAKARPGELNYTAPTGAHPHLDMLALLSATGLKMTHLPSKGAGQTIPLLLSGESQLSNTNVASVIGLIRAGRLKAYAVTSDSRIAELADVPTFSELGLKEVGSINWVGLFTQSGTPRAIIGKLHSTIIDVLSQPEVKEIYAKRLVPLAVSASPAEFNAFVASETKRWMKIVKDNNVRLD
jgi:tripartite-type tricarboxylate transporter receptor subunit TctC